MKIDFKNKLVCGWAEALFSVLIMCGIANTFIGYSVQKLEVNFLVFTSAVFASCSFVLMLIGGQGPFVRQTLRSIDTWSYGILLLLNYVLLLALFSYMTPTEGSLLKHISLLFSIVLSWFFLGRVPTKGQLVGCVIVMGGIAVVCEGLPMENRGMIYLIMLLEGIVLAARIFVAEIHRPHQQAMLEPQNPRAKARVVGFVIFITSTLFLTMMFLFALLQAYTPLNLHSDLVPDLDDFFHAPSIFSGLIIGLLFIAPIRFLEFSSTAVIKTENMLAVATLASASTLFWEWVFSPFTGMSLKAVTGTDIWAGLFIMSGASIAALTQIRKSKSNASDIVSGYLSYQSQNISAVQDTREMVANTLEHYQGRVKKAATALQVPEAVIHALLRDADQVLAIKPERLSEISRLYRQNVAMADPLTGLPNRSTFMMALRAAGSEMDQFAVMFIDLNKFKIVNDTYGHEAGDVILKGIATRLQTYLPAQAELTRLGGDEYCILLPGKDREGAKKIIPDVLGVIEQSFELDGVEIPVAVSASIGVSSYPVDAQDIEELLDKADKAMYDAKGEGEPR